MWLLVDHSNQFSKFALGDRYGLQPLDCRLPSGGWRAGSPPPELAAELADLKIIPTGLAICGVRRDNADLAAALRPLLASDTPTPFLLRAENSGLEFPNHPQPSRIGADRLANVIAAAATAAPGQPVIAVDAGTAVTCDAVLAGSPPVFLGGAISAGLATQARALHSQTALLPELTPPFSKDTPALGQATAEAIRAALVHGFAAMVAGIVEAQRRELTALGHPPPAVLLTGGDAAMLADSPHFAMAGVRRNLTLEGLRIACVAAQALE